MNLIVLGASARAAAFSAIRAGLRPWCVDLFGDADLARACPVRRIAPDDYPTALVDALADAPAGPVLYTGGLENYPGLVERIDRPLWGNSAAVLRRVRSPIRLAEALHRHGLPTLAVSDAPPAPDGRRWLVKPLRSGGGLGIRTYRGKPFDPRTHYAQEFGPGPRFATLFLGLPNDSAQLLGTTRLIAPPWLHAPRFAYAGNVGPLPMPAEPLQTIGNLIAHDFGVRGLFGVDWVRRHDRATGQTACLPLEVNPRYTASVEVLERAWGASLLGLHRAVFDRSWAAPSLPGLPRRRCGKAIFYARHALTFPTAGPWSAALQLPPDDSSAEYGDIPHASEVIARRQPVLSMFAEGTSSRQCLRALQDRAGALDRRLGGQ